MGWLIKKDPPHECARPPATPAQPGDAWQCDDCVQIWIVTDRWPYTWRRANQYDFQRLREIRDA